MDNTIFECHFLDLNSIFLFIRKPHLFTRAFNARLRGWQRITTKLKHNNRNHRGSMGLETPRVDSPS
ncbi:hypothetical protein FXE74_15785 [Vibrio cholerae]|nr:hypothetical protein [Vibrio cholerae]TXY52601.1 hypothetical protein FXE74_15785 [Vibrio cholerae]